MNVRLEVAGRDGAARTGLVHTARGAFAVPCFMPVGTRGAVPTLSAADLEDLGAEIILANTYHLMLRPGADVVAELGDIHGFSSFNGHVLTDSGGYQTMSLSGAIDDDGVLFASVYDGTPTRLTPEGAVAVQELLGADIQMALDVCPRLPADAATLRLAVERTAAWAARAKAAKTRDAEALFGIVQGGADPALRRESAAATVAIGFDGYGIGGMSVGEDREEMLEALAATLEVLPADRPRYVMGLGDPIGLVEAVGLGADMFDCVAPARLARHGTVLTAGGRLALRNARHARSADPLDAACPCPVCARYSRAYLRHLLGVGEPTALRLLTVHNISFTLALMAAARSAIETGTLDALRRSVRAVWAPRPDPGGGGD